MKRRGRKAAVFAGVLTALTLGALGYSWKGFLERWYCVRIARDPAYILTLIERPEGSPERRAIRRYFRNRAAAGAETERWVIQPDSGDDSGSDSEEWSADSLEPGISVRAEAETREALLALVRPTLTLNETEMVWIREGTPGEPSFVLDRALVCRPRGKKARWMLFRFGEDFEERYSLFQKRPLVAQSVDEMRAPPDPEGRVLYEVGWESSDLGAAGSNSAKRRLYFLKDLREGWSFLGEGPTEESVHGYVTAIERNVECNGSAKNSIAIHFSKSEVRYQDEWVRETIYQDYVLEGNPPQLFEVGESYVKAEEGDTVDSIASRLVESGEEKGADLPWRVALLELNPDLPEGPLPSGTRLRYGGCSPWQRLLRPSR